MNKECSRAALSGQTKRTCLQKSKLTSFHIDRSFIDWKSRCQYTNGGTRKMSAWPRRRSNGGKEASLRKKAPCYMPYICRGLQAVWTASTRSAMHIRSIGVLSGGIGFFTFRLTQPMSMPSRNTRHSTESTVLTCSSSSCVLGDSWSNDKHTCCKVCFQRKWGWQSGSIITPNEVWLKVWPLQTTSRRNRPQGVGVAGAPQKARKWAQGLYAPSATSPYVLVVPPPSTWPGDMK